MSDKVTTIKASDLTLEHLYCVVEANGHAGQLIGWDEPLQRLDAVSNNLVDYRYLVIGPSQEPRQVRIDLDTEIWVLNAPKPDSPILHFASGGTE